MAEDMGVKVIGELYADLDYLSDGTTTIKKVHGPIDVEETVAKVIKMVVDGKVKTIDGREISVVGSSVCFHGDNPQSPQVIQGVKKVLKDKGIRVVNITNQLEE
jgi:UPF0271 protein